MHDLIERSDVSSKLKKVVFAYHLFFVDDLNVDFKFLVFC